MNQDEGHLRLLSIFHYVVGGIMPCSPAFRASIWGWELPWSPACCQFSQGNTDSTFLGMAFHRHCVGDHSRWLDPGIAI